MTCSAIAFFSLRVMQVGEFTAIVMLTPLVLTMVAAVALHERISWLRWACVLGGFAGTLVVIRPGAGLFEWVMLLPLLLVLANTAFQVLTSRLTQTEDPGTMHFYTGLVGLAATSAALPLAWKTLPAAVWGGAGADRPDRRAGSLPADHGLHTCAGGGADTLPVPADRLCGAGRLGGLRPRARRPVAGRHRAHRGAAACSAPG
jgi:hypothetical protein